MGGEGGEGGGGEEERESGGGSEGRGVGLTRGREREFTRSRYFGLLDVAHAAAFPIACLEIDTDDPYFGR